MEDREILKTDASRHLIMQDAVQGSGQEAHRNDLEAFHVWSIEFGRSCICKNILMDAGIEQVS
jgi:hypothetical protein